jgi:hypothetical protein
LTLQEAFKGNAHLLVVGKPGSGKTFVLAHLAGQMASGGQLPDHLKNALPVFVHAADILLPPANPENPLAPLIGAITYICPSLSVARLEAFLPAALSSGRSL